MSRRSLITVNLKVWWVRLNVQWQPGTPKTLVNLNPPCLLIMTFMSIALDAVLATPRLLQINVPGQTCDSAPSKSVLARIERKSAV